MTKKDKDRVRTIYTEMLGDGQITVAPASNNSALLANIDAAGIQYDSRAQIASAIGQAYRLNHTPDYRRVIAHMLNDLQFFEDTKPWTRDTVYQWLYPRKGLHTLPLRDPTTIVKLMVQIMYIEHSNRPLPPAFDIERNTREELLLIIRQTTVTIRELLTTKAEQRHTIDSLSAREANLSAALSRLDRKTYKVTKHLVQNYSAMPFIQN